MLQQSHGASQGYLPWWWYSYWANHIEMAPIQHAVHSATASYDMQYSAMVNLAISGNTCYWVHHDYQCHETSIMSSSPPWLPMSQDQHYVLFITMTNNVTRPVLSIHHQYHKASINAFITMTTNVTRPVLCHLHRHDDQYHKTSIILSSSPWLPMSEGQYYPFITITTKCHNTSIIHSSPM